MVEHMHAFANYLEQGTKYIAAAEKLQQDLLRGELDPLGTGAGGPGTEGGEEAGAGGDEAGEHQE
jgi:hypothetical protein